MASAIFDKVIAVLNGRGYAHQASLAYDCQARLKLIVDAYLKVESAYLKGLETVWEQVSKTVESFPFAKLPLQYLKDLLSMSHEHIRNFVNSLRDDMLTSIKPEDVKKEGKTVTQSKVLRQACIKGVQELKNLYERRESQRAKLAVLKQQLGSVMQSKSYEDKSRRQANQLYIRQRTEVNITEQSCLQKLQEVKSRAKQFDSRSQLAVGRVNGQQFVSNLFSWVVKLFVLWAEVLKNQDYDFNRMLQKLEAKKAADQSESVTVLVGEESAVLPLLEELMQ